MMEKTWWPGLAIIAPVRTVLSPLSCYNYWDFDRSAPATTCSTFSLLILAWRTGSKPGSVRLLESFIGFVDSWVGGGGSVIYRSL